MFSLQQPTSRLKGQVCSLTYKLAATWFRLTCTPRTWTNSCIWLCNVDDSSINIVVVLLLLLLGMYVNHEFTIAVITVIFALCRDFRQLPWCCEVWIIAAHPQCIYGLFQNSWGRHHNTGWIKILGISQLIIWHVHLLLLSFFWYVPVSIDHVTSWLQSAWETVIIFSGGPLLKF